MSGSSPGFGPASFAFSGVGPDGKPDRQAGSHPYELNVAIGLNSVFRKPPDYSLSAVTTQDVKDVVVDLPLGFVASTLSAPQCTQTQLSSQEGCPANTRVGHLTAGARNHFTVDSDIWNLVPERGVPAEFGYLDSLDSAHILYSRVVPTAS